MHKAARAEGPSHISHSVAFEARPADDSGAPVGSSCRYVPAVTAELEDWVVQGVTCTAHPHIHPAARS
eukprot:7183034-Alexandrium_andersonii.AAC.1